MNWTEVNIYTTTEGIEPVCGRLLNVGVTGFQIRDAKDFEDFLNDKTGNWDYIDDDLMNLKDCETCVTFYLADNSQGADWANNWKQYFKPLTVGDKLVIKPSWEKYDGNDSRTILEIDPESSFGTGQHNTTQLCLELLEECLNEGDRVLDIGCGSGILSIAAMLLGADSACAVDIDLNSVKIAGQNAAKNHIAPEKYVTYAGNIISDEALREKIGGGYQLITANIVADVLIAMAPIFGKFLVPHGKIIISGIIIERCDEVMEAMEKNGFARTELRESGGWAAASFEIA